MSANPPHDLQRLPHDLLALWSGLGDLGAMSFYGVLATVPALISAIDIDGNVIFVSRHHLKLQGVADAITEIVHECDLYPSYVQARFKKALQHALASGCDAEWELSIKHKGGETHLYHMRHTLLKNPNPDGTPSQMIFSVGVDISDNKASDQALRDHKSRMNYMAFHDSVTGLPNRSLFYDRIHLSLSRAQRSNGHLALMLIDLDRFKQVNDSFGYEAGDQLLKHAAACLQDELRGTDTVARLGGDEFVVVLDNVQNPYDIEVIAGKLLESVARPLRIEGCDVSCTASMGISLFPRDGDSADQLLKQADLAMYRAKAAGKNRLQFYIKAMTETAVNYLLLENDLRVAIDNQDLALYYQPQIDLRTNKIIGLEALVRWNHKDRGMVSPVDFIPLAEETGLIEPLGEWVLRHACERFQSWLMQGINLGKVAVNLSARQFRREHFEQTVIQILTDTRLSPQYLELELTETSAMENAKETIAVLNCLNEMGLSLAIDDFGTGYSSLAYLQRFPIQKLKIDRAFIMDIDKGESYGAIAKSVIDLAHNMSLRVIAEGVERVSQSAWLAQRGCDQVQGFYYAKPLSEADLMALVEDPTRTQKSSTGVRLLGF